MCGFHYKPILACPPLPRPAHLPLELSTPAPTCPLPPRPAPPHPPPTCAMALMFMSALASALIIVAALPLRFTMPCASRHTSVGVQHARRIDRLCVSTTAPVRQKYPPFPLSPELLPSKPSQPHTCPTAASTQHFSIFCTADTRPALMASLNL